MKTLVLAEKPSVARDIARVLGASQKGDGCIVGEKYVVTWAIGHLVSLCEPDEMDPVYKKWRMDALPILPGAMKTKVLPKTKKQFETVRRLLNDSGTDRVICATDSGREGELIFRYIYMQARCEKPVDRLWISSMTDAAIREGFARLRPDAEYDALYASARCRSEADWLVGMNATRAFTLRFDALLSIGRVQTPTLGLIVARDREISSFVPRDYYEIRADFGDYTGLWLDPATEQTRCADAETAEAVRKAVSHGEGVITQASSEPKRMPPPFLYDLTSLQRDANRVCGFSASKTLEITQALYETHKLVTYPRTDSRFLPRDMIPKIEKTLRAFPAPYADLAAPVRDKPTTAARLYNDAKVTDHHAIVPTGQFGALGRLKEDERRVFDLIAKRLIAAHYPDYEYLSRTILTRVAPHVFKSTGVTVRQEGWRALYRDESQPSKDGDDQQQTLPDVRVGDTRAVQKVSVKKCKTKPPAPMNDASLLGMMEHAGRLIEDEALRESMKDAGLGTPATRAAVIERLIEVKYISRKGKTLVSTEKGRRIIDAVPEQIRSAETTGKWERALTHIRMDDDPARRAAREEKFMDSIRRFSAFLVDSAKNAPQDVTFEKEERRGRGQSRPRGLGVKCPVCGQGTVTVNARAFGCSRWREGCKFTIWRNQLDRHGVAEITDAMGKKLLKGEGVPCEGGAAYWKDGAFDIRKAP